MHEQTSSTKRKRSSTSKSRQNSAKKKADSTPRKGKGKAPVHPDDGPASPKKATSTRKLTPSKDEDAESPEVVQVSSASKNTRSSHRKENTNNDSVQEKLPKKRLRESSEEEQFEPMRKRLRSSMEMKEAGLKFVFHFGLIYLNTRNIFSHRKEKRRREADDQHTEVFETAESSEENSRM